MNFIKSLCNANTVLCNAQERGLLNWDDYYKISNLLLEAMESWTSDFNYDLESEQDLADTLKYINSKKGGNK